MTEEKLSCRIVANNLSIKVKAGEFNGCLKVSEEDPELPGSIKYNYYAPETGWILDNDISFGRQGTFQYGTFVVQGIA